MWIFIFSSDRDYEDKPFEEEDLPTGFDSDHSDDDEEDNNWSDWRGNLSGAVCLFCPANYTEFSDLLKHMNIVHEFDYENLKSQLSLNFYQQIKLINFIRRQMHLLQVNMIWLLFKAVILGHIDQLGWFFFPENHYIL